MNKDHDTINYLKGEFDHYYGVIVTYPDNINNDILWCKLGELLSHRNFTNFRIIGNGFNFSLKDKYRTLNLSMNENIFDNMFGLVNKAELIFHCYFRSIKLNKNNESSWIALAKKIISGELVINFLNIYKYQLAFEDFIRLNSYIGLDSNTFAIYCLIEALKIKQCSLVWYDLYKVLETQISNRKLFFSKDWDTVFKGFPKYFSNLSDINKAYKLSFYCLIKSTNVCNCKIDDPFIWNEIGKYYYNESVTKEEFNYLSPHFLQLFKTNKEIAFYFFSKVLTLHNEIIANNLQKILKNDDDKSLLIQFRRNEKYYLNNISFTQVQPKTLYQFKNLKSKRDELENPRPTKIIKKI